MQVEYGQVHTGDVLLGHDGNTWGVESIAPGVGEVTVTLVRHGQRVTGRPPTGTEVTRIAAADMAAEADAWQVLHAAGLNPEVVAEWWSAE